MPVGKAAKQTILIRSFANNSGLFSKKINHNRVKALFEYAESYDLNLAIMIIQ